MKAKAKTIEIINEHNDLGKLWIDKLIERLLLEELGFSSKIQATVLREFYKKQVKLNNEVNNKHVT